jgi:hypothetical protein
MMANLFPCASKATSLNGGVGRVQSQCRAKCRPAAPGGRAPPAPAARVGSVEKMQRRRSKHGNVFTHLTAAVVVPGCIALCWWQVTRALSGNTLSWAYVFEWPIFAGYAVFMWWKLIHDHPVRAEATVTPTVTGGDPVVHGDLAPGSPSDRAVAGPTQGGAGVAPATTDRDREEETEMASYNDYLAALHASGKRKHW